MAESGEGCLIGLVVVIEIAVVIGSGILAWNWVDPDSFGRGLVFLIVWGLLSALGYGLARLLGGIIAGIIGALNK